MVNIAVFTTVAQHRKGADIHLRNLQWALQGLDFKIYLQTFRDYSFDFDVELIEAESNPSDFCFFWDKTGNYIREHCREADLFLFTEQDIFFTKRLEGQIRLAHSNRSIQLNMESDYLSVFDHERNKLYPRIFEGATIIPAEYIFRAVDDGVALGSHPTQLFGGKYYTTSKNVKLEFRTIRDYIENSDYVDTLFEFSVFCFTHNFPFLSHASDFNYEASDSCVHFRAIEMMCHDCPRVYDDINEASSLASSRPSFNRLLNGCALMLLLSGAHERSPIMQELLLNDHLNSLLWTRKKIDALCLFAKEWMTPAEYKNLLWAKQVVHQKILM